MNLCSVYDNLHIHVIRTAAGISLWQSAAAAAVTIDCQRDGQMNKLCYTTISHTAELVDKIRLDFLKLTVFWSTMLNYVVPYWYIFPETPQNTNCTQISLIVHSKNNSNNVKSIIDSGTWCVLAFFMWGTIVIPDIIWLCLLSGKG